MLDLVICRNVIVVRYDGEVHFIRGHMYDDGVIRLGCPGIRDAVIDELHFFLVVMPHGSIIDELICSCPGMTDRLNECVLYHSRRDTAVSRSGHTGLFVHLEPCSDRTDLADAAGLDVSLYLRP